MDALKKILQTLQVYYDKILLGVMLASLATVLVMQSCSIISTNRLIEGIVEPKLLPAGDIQPLDEQKLVVRLDVDQAHLWQPIHRVERLGDYQLDGVSISLRSYLRTYGETSLFDPAVYVYSSHDQRNLMHYHTVQNPFTGLYEQGAEPIKPPTPHTGTIPTPPTSSEPLITHVRLVRSVAKNLPLILMKITIADRNDKTTWIAQANLIVDNRFKTQFLRIGDQLELTGLKGTYKVVDMEYETTPDEKGVPKEASTITLREGDDGQRYVLPRRQYVPIGSVTYMLVVLPQLGTGQNPVSIQAGQDQPFPVTYGVGPGLRSTYYKITGQNGNDLLAVETDQTGKPVRETVYVIGRLTQADISKYQRPVPESTVPELTPGP